MGSVTENYQLHQWEANDSFLRTDFNEDNAKIDAALAGMPKVITGSYTGTGTYGQNSPNVLDFADTLGKVPALLYICADNGAYKMTLIPGQSTQNSSNSYANTVQWTGTGVSWYNTSNKNGQMNNETVTYLYVAIG